MDLRLFVDIMFAISTIYKARFDVSRFEIWPPLAPKKISLVPWDLTELLRYEDFNQLQIKPQWKHCIKPQIKQDKTAPVNYLYTVLLYFTSSIMKYKKQLTNNLGCCISSFTLQQIKDSKKI